MEWLNFSFLGDLGAGAIVVIFVLAMLTGKLRPQRAVDEVRSDRDARLNEMKERYSSALEVAKVWEEAYRTTEEARNELAKNLDRIEQQQAAIERAIVILTRQVAAGGDDSYGE